MESFSIFRELITKPRITRKLQFLKISKKRHRNSDKYPLFHRLARKDQKDNTSPPFSSVALNKVKSF